MTRFAAEMVIAAGLVAAASLADAGGGSIGVGVISDRDSGNFGDPKNTKYELNGAYNSDSGLIYGDSFQYTDITFSDRVTQNLEATIGYRVPLGLAFSLSGNVGIGEHWRQNPSAAFPYYVLRIATDFKLSQLITWNAISYRFRDAFNHEADYNTPQIATGLTFNLEEQKSISVKIMRDWRDGQPNNTGLSLGFRQAF